MNNCVPEHDRQRLLLFGLFNQGLISRDECVLRLTDETPMTVLEAKNYIHEALDEETELPEHGDWAIPHHYVPEYDKWKEEMRQWQAVKVVLAGNPHLKEVTIDQYVGMIVNAKKLFNLTPDVSDDTERVLVFRDNEHVVVGMCCYTMGGQGESVMIYYADRDIGYVVI